MTTRGHTIHTHPAPRNRNPWGGGGGSSSGSSRTYHCPADCYQEPVDWYSQPARTPSPQYDVIQGPRLNRLTLAPVSSRPITPASTVHTHTEATATIDPCGGHCTAFENFCHYCLQVLFIAGVLTGISLVIAGSVLRGQKRGGDLMVLVYIGCLTAMVCSLLLSVQCCVRRNVNRRKRARNNRTVTANIPLRDLGPPPSAELTVPMQYEPLLHQQIQVPYNQRYIPEPFIDPASRDLSGTPWWRRQPPITQSHKPVHSQLRKQMPL